VKLEKKIKIGLIVSLILFIVTAYFSEGFFHPDEHFQLIEFVNFKLGNTTLAQLPWEFNERIRPGLQVALGYFFIKSFGFFGINNPFVQTMLLRIITAMLSWLVMSRLFLVLIMNIKNERVKWVFLFLSFYLWFIPFLSVRFSSENYGAVALLAGIYCILKSPIKSAKNYIFPLMAGVFLGLSFFFRFQMAFSIVGIGLWLLLIRKENWKYIALFCTGGIAITLLCVGIDYWLYGSFEFTPYNYYTANITLNLAAEWGTMPWWFYLNSYILQGIPPLTLVLLGLFIWGIYTKPTSLFVWCILPFLIAHFAVGHKELRFLFPMIFCFTYIAALGLDAFLEKYNFKKSLQLFTIVALVINTPILIVKAVTPAQEAVSYFRFLYDISKQQKIVLISPEKSIYNITGVTAHFYKNENITDLITIDETKILECLNELNSSKILVLNRNIMTEPTFKGYKRKPLYCAYPKWIKQINFFNWISRSRIWEIDEVEVVK